MAAGLGFKTFTTGEVLTAADVNGYLMQGVLVFASAAARNAAITSPQEGQFAFTKDTNGLWYYDGAAWVASGATGDIEGVTAGVGISGGGTSGTVTITNSMATEITAKGDLIVGTGSATFDNLAAGSNGDTLVADSSTSTGLRYTAGTVQSNPVLNSAFQIWQRGISVSVAASTSNAYTADRWGLVTGANQASTVSRQATGDTTNLPAIQYCGRFQRNSGQTGTQTFYVSNAFETINSIPFVGKTVTFSFYARVGADYSGGAMTGRLLYGTGTDQQSNTGYTGAAVVASTAPTLTTTWQRFTATGTVATTANELSCEFSWTPTGTASTNDYVELTGVQIDIGSVALPFRTYAATIQGELAACQRYCYGITAGSNYPSRAIDSGFLYQGGVPFQVTMRSAPTLRSGGTFGASSGNAGTVAMDGSSTESANLYNSASNWSTGASIRYTVIFEAEL